MPRFEIVSNQIRSGEPGPDLEQWLPTVTLLRRHGEAVGALLASRVLQHGYAIVGGKTLVFGVKSSEGEAPKTVVMIEAGEADLHQALEALS